MITLEAESPSSHGLTSIVLVTHNELAYTRFCIDSVLQKTELPIELIIVDNGSTDGTVEYLRSLGENSQASATTASELQRIIVVSNPDNRGFPAAANEGVTRSSGRQILLLNNDTIVTHDWLSRMLRSLRCEPTIGMVGPCSNFVSGPQCVSAPYGWEAGSQEWATGSIDEFMSRWSSAIDEFAERWGRANDGKLAVTQRLVGFCLLIRREVVEKIGLLDERFGIGNFEDDDYCRRAREAGFRLVVAIDAFVHHFGGRTFLGAKVKHDELMRRNEQLYREKWNEGSRGSTECGESAKAALPLPNADLVAKRSTITANPQSLTTGPLISLCMIARNNERTVEAAIEGIRPQVDEIIVVDTGSTDRTPEIAARLGARVFHFPWCDDFSAARNESIRHAVGQWIFWMDTDDIIDAENARLIRELVTRDISPTTMGFLMKVRCPIKTENGDTGFIEVDQVKLFRNLPELRFEFRIHEQVMMAIRRAGGTVPWTDIFVVHANSDNSPEARTRKIERDLRIVHLDHQERPDHPFVLFNLGMTLAEAGRHEEAIGFLWQTIGLAGEDESHLRKAYALLVSSYHQLGRRTTAWEACIKGLKQFPDDPELRFRQAAMLREVGNLADAARAYEELLALQNGRHLSSVDHGIKGYRTRHNLAEIYAELGDLAKAENLWKQVIQEAPSFRSAWRGLGDILVRQGKTDEAFRLVELMEATAGSPDLACDARLLRADTLARLGKTSLARDELNAAIEATPDDLNLLECRCRLVFEHFPPSEAEFAFRELLARDPQNAAAQHNLGSILYKLGRFDQSAAAFRESLRARPNSPSTYLHLGYALRETGKLDDATAAWEEVLKLAPSDPAATEALQKARERRNG